MFIRCSFKFILHNPTSLSLRTAPLSMEPLPHLWQPAQSVPEVISIPTIPQLWQPVQSVSQQDSQIWKPLQMTFPIRLSPVRTPNHEPKPAPVQRGQEHGTEPSPHIYNTLYQTIPPQLSFPSAEKGKQYIKTWALKEGFEIANSSSNDNCIYMICHRGYNMGSKTRETRRQRLVKSCGCRFKCSLRRQSPGWSLRVSNATHNHARSDTSTLALARKMEMDQALPIIESQLKLPPQEILEIIHRRAADIGLKSSIRIRDVGDVRARISRERRLHK